MGDSIQWWLWGRGETSGADRGSRGWRWTAGEGAGRTVPAAEMLLVCSEGAARLGGREVTGSGCIWRALPPCGGGRWAAVKAGPPRLLPWAG